MLVADPLLFLSVYRGNNDRAVEIPGVGVPGVDSFGKFAGVIAGVASFSLELTP